MRQYFIIATLLSVAVSPLAFSQDQTEGSDEIAQDSDGNTRGDRGNREDDKHRNKRKNNDLSDKALRIIDTDEDGKISVEEYMAHAQQRFSDLDLDGDNFVTSEEAKEAAEIMRERQKEARSALDRRKNQSENSSE
ncbi:hypothetical protein N9060_00750 [Arenicella sp.]|nr:hypothetical protein [Arenicella sp.]